MKKSAIIICLLLLSVYTLFAQEIVDIKESNNWISNLKNTNQEHNDIITVNAERKSFLNTRISESESRLAQLDTDIAYANTLNQELNAAMRDTKDKDAKKIINEARFDLLSVRWLLETEEEFLDTQTASDNKEVAFIIKDTARRNRLITANNEEIADLESSVIYTQNQLDALQAKIADLKSRLSSITSNIE